MINNPTGYNFKRLPHYCQMCNCFEIRGKYARFCSDICVKQWKLIKAANYNNYETRKRLAEYGLRESSVSVR